MARLVIYVPFKKGAGVGDIRENATQVKESDLEGFTIGGHLVTAVVVLYKDQEGDYNVTGNDFVCVLGHGGPRDYTAVTDNLGNEMSLLDLMDNLDTMNAENARAIYFFICYSAEQNHIAAQWKAAFPAQTVYGATQFAQGGLIRTTRTRKIRNSIFDEDNGQLRLVA
jgi:hypothetical protein